MMALSNTKIFLASAVVLMIGLPHLAQAQTVPSLSGLYACETLTTPDAQLACFRAETAKLRAGAGAGVAAPLPAPVMAPRKSLAAPQAPTSAVAPAIAPAALKAPEFAPLPETSAKAPKTRSMTIVSTANDAKGYVRFTLENGEVWQQIEKARVRLGRAEGPDALTIKKKSFGSFLATVNGKRPSFKVRRVE